MTTARIVSLSLRSQFGFPLVSPAIEMQLEMHGTGRTDGAHTAIVKTEVSVCAVVCLCQAALMLAAHVVGLQMDCAGSGYVTDGTVMRPAVAAKTSRQALCGGRGVAGSGPC